MRRIGLIALLAASSANAQFFRPAATGTLGFFASQNAAPALSATGSLSLVSRYVAITATPLELEFRAPVDDGEYGWDVDNQGNSVCRSTGRGGPQVADSYCRPLVTPAISAEALGIIPLGDGVSIAGGYGRRASLDATFSYIVGSILVGPSHRAFHARVRANGSFVEAAAGLSVGFPSRDDIRRARRGDRRGRPPVPRRPEG